MERYRVTYAVLSALQEQICIYSTRISRAMRYAKSQRTHLKKRIWLFLLLFLADRPIGRTRPGYLFAARTWSGLQPISHHLTYKCYVTERLTSKFFFSCSTNNMALRDVTKTRLSHRHVSKPCIHQK